MPALNARMIQNALNLFNKRFILDMQQLTKT